MPLHGRSLEFMLAKGKHASMSDATGKLPIVTGRMQRHSFVVKWKITQIHEK
jgi:hypothetical protein